MECSGDCSVEQERAKARVDCFALNRSMEEGEFDTLTVSFAERHWRRNVRNPSGQRLLDVSTIIQLTAHTETRNVSQS